MSPPGEHSRAACPVEHPGLGSSHCLAVPQLCPCEALGMLGAFVQHPGAIHKIQSWRHTRRSYLPTRPDRVFGLPSQWLASTCWQNCRPGRELLGVPTVVSAIGLYNICKKRIQLPMRRQQHGMSAAEVRQHKTACTSHCLNLKAPTLRYPRGPLEKGTNSEFVLVMFSV